MFNHQDGISITNNIEKGTVFSFSNFRGFIDNVNYQRLISKLINNKKVVKWKASLDDKRLFLYKAKSDINLLDYDYEHMKSVSKPLDTLKPDDIVCYLNLNVMRSKYTQFISRLLKEKAITKIGRVKTGHVGNPPIAYQVTKSLCIGEMLGSSPEPVAKPSRKKTVRVGNSPAVYSTIRRTNK